MDLKKTISEVRKVKETVSAQKNETETYIKNFKEEQQKQQEIAVKQAGAATVDAWGDHLKAMLEYRYLKGRTAADYQETYQALPRMAKPQVKDIKRFRADS